MKKIIIMTASLLFVSSMALAGGKSTSTADLDMTLDAASTGLSLYGDTSTATASSPLIGKNSTGVGLAIFTNNNGYSMTTQHIKGSKAFASSYDATSIFSTNVSTEGAVELDLSATDTSDFSDWDTL